MRCFLATESVKGTTAPPFNNENRGSFFDAGIAVNMACTAVTGQRGEDAKKGMVMVVHDFLSCRVFDHLIIMVQKDGEKIKSPLVRCLVRSNCLVA